MDRGYSNGRWKSVSGGCSNRSSWHSMRCMSSSGLLNSVDEVYFVTTFSTQRHEKKTFTSFYAFDLNILLDVKEIYDFQENKHISPFPILFLCFFCELYHWNF